MAKTKLSKAISNLAWQPRPQFLQGEGTTQLQEIWKAQTKDNEFLGWIYDAKTQTLEGSSPLRNAKLDALVRPLGLQVATTHDLYKPEIRAMLQGNFYSDDPGLILRGHKNQGNPRNTPIIDQLVELVEDTNGSVKFPLLISGYDVKPFSQDKDGYALQIVAKDDFTALQDGRLQGENNGKTFSEVDKDGLPKFTQGGKFNFYANDNATLSRLCVSYYGTLDSNNGNVSTSNDDGRVVLIPAEGDTQNFAQSSLSELKKTYDAEITKIHGAYEAAVQTFESRLQK